MNNSVSHNITSQLKNIKCLQINLQRSKSATANLKQYIIDNNYDIVFIQEPYVIKSKVSGFPLNYRLFYKESEAIKTAVIVINPRITVIFIGSLSNQFSTLVRLEFKDKTVFGISLYCSPLQSKIQFNL